MTKVTMPGPTAWMLAVQTMGGDVGWKLSWSQSGAGVCHRLSGDAHEKPLITTGQAEAYKDACVREALEEAINLSSMYGATIELDAAIRALIPA